MRPARPLQPAALGATSAVDQAGQFIARRPAALVPAARRALLCRPMRMLHLGLRVTDRERSLAFYTALGYVQLGFVPETGFGSLTMLKLPDDPFVSLELVHDAARPVKDTGAVNHLVVQVDDLDATIAGLAAKGVAAEPPADLGEGMRTSWLTDPDGYRIELVQWPPGHPAGMTAADFG
ncbi:VOC family protein [Actinomadura sp. ATCC 31491]|uniref:VOC family protein n=1 Tax=Actinomadura luzonensis TaxID=2805427 RepID=A0ABT0FK19_9ACTN|nr:VOC family protein [Actinomadura luzonensis]MCK2212326.1 VOC family protein [Actinomadura luzonensis]